MAKPMLVTKNMAEETIEALKKKIEEIKTNFENTRAPNGTIKFEIPYLWSAEDVIRPQVKFTATAWLKIVALISMHDKEIAWHGVVTRTDDSHFVVEDIMMYPQKVLSAYVEDDDNHAEWIASLPRETLQKLKLQGHSHVSFSAKPSQTDLDNWESYARPLRNDNYYIFMIVNKKWELTMRIYDLLTNSQYENDDIDVVIECDGCDDLIKWCKEEKKENIKETVYVSNAPAQKTENKKENTKQTDNSKALSTYYNTSTLAVFAYDISKYLSITYAEANVIYETLKADVHSGLVDNTRDDLLERAEELYYETYDIPPYYDDRRLI